MATSERPLSASVIPSALRREIDSTFFSCASKPILPSAMPAWMVPYSVEVIQHVRFLIIAGCIISATPLPAFGEEDEWMDVDRELFEELVSIVKGATAKQDARDMAAALAKEDEEPIGDKYEDESDEDTQTIGPGSEQDEEEYYDRLERELEASDEEDADDLEEDVRVAFRTLSTEDK